MKINFNRNQLLIPLQQVSGIVERRQILPILSHVLVRVKDGILSVTATDQVVEITTRHKIEFAEELAFTLPARKLLDICRSLPEDSNVSLSIKNERATLISGSSRFALAIFPVKDFPLMQDFAAKCEFSLPQKDLKYLIDSTQFSMAQQDVRLYLNGLLLEIQGSKLTSVTTDGHRLSYCRLEMEGSNDESHQIIIPRKGVQEIAKLLKESPDFAQVRVGSNFISIRLDEVEFSAKLIEGKFPDYERVLPKSAEIRLVADREVLRQALIRTSILSNEKYRGIRFTLSNNKLCIQAHNPEHEEAEVEMEIQYEGQNVEVGFNVNYLLDALAAIADESVQISMADSNSSCLVQQPNNSNCKYVIMPMLL